MKSLYMLLVAGMVAGALPLASAQSQSNSAAETEPPAEQPAAASPASSDTPSVPAATSADAQAATDSSAAPATTSDTAANSEAPPSAQTKDKQEVVDVAALQAAGYKIVNEKGTKLYCKREPVTGSRLQFRTRCFTQDELIRSQNNAAEMLSELSRKAPVPRGN